MGGRFFKDGECLRPGPGSFSYDCAFLNKDEPMPSIRREIATLFKLDAPNTLRWVLLGTAAAGVVIWKRQK